MKKFIISGLVALVGVIALIWNYQSGEEPIIVSNFDECIAQGYPVLESYPRQCKTPEGQTFVEDIGNELEKTVTLYYYNYELDKDESGNIACSRNGLVPIQREIPITRTPIQDTIKLLLRGELTAEERDQGVDTEYPLAGLSLIGASLNDGVLTLEFDDPQNRTGGGSCRVGILWFQIEVTAKQFSEVKQVRFLPEELFQP